MTLDSEPLLSGYVEPFVMPAATGSSTAMALGAAGAGGTAYPSKYDSARSTMYSNSAGQSSRLSYHLTPDGLHASGASSSSGGVAARPSSSGNGKGAPPDTPAARPVRQETDAGPIPVAAEHDEEVLPPGYNPAWMSA